MPALTQAKTHAKKRPLRQMRRAARALLAALALGSLYAFPAQAEQAKPDLAESLPAARSPTGSFLAAQIATFDGDIDSAAVFFARAAANPPEDISLKDFVGINTRAFTLLLASGRIGDAMQIGKRITQIDPKNHLPGLALAVNAMSRNETRLAGLILQTAGTGPLEKLASNGLLAWNRAIAGDIEGGIRRLGAKAPDQWQNFFQLWQRGLLEDMAGKSAAAAADLKQAIGLDASSLRLSEAYARAMWRAGQKDDAKKFLAGIMAKTQAAPSLEALAALFNADAAVTPLIGSGREGAAELLSGLGQIIARDDASEQAAVLLQLSLLLAPNADAPHLDLADMNQKAGQFAAANRQLAAIQPSSPYYHAATIQMAFNADHGDTSGEAASRLNAMLATNPKDVDAALALGNILRSHSKFAEAEKAYSQAIEASQPLDPRTWEIFYDRGICRERLGRWPDAETDFLKALSFAPNQPEVLNYLAYTWIDKGMNYDRALPMLLKAVESAPNDGYIVDSLGWAYFKLGRWDDAVKTMEKAVDLKTGDSTVNEHLGDSYWRAGRKLEARYQWRKAIDLKPTEPGQLDGLTKKLAEGLPPLAKPAVDAAVPADKVADPAAKAAGAKTPVSQ